MDDDDDKKIIDLTEHRRSLAETLKKKREAGKDVPETASCPECDSILFIVCFVTEDDINEHCVFCQHCGEPLGVITIFDDEDEDEE